MMKFTYISDSYGEENMLSKAIVYDKSKPFWNGYSQKLTWLFIMIFMVVFPLFVDSTGYVKLTEAKYHFFVWVTSTYLVLMLLGYIVALIKRDTKFPSVRNIIKEASFTQKALVAFLISVLISSAFSPYKVFLWVGIGRYDGLCTILLYLATFFTVSVFGKLDKWHLIGFSISMTILSIIGIFQFLGINVFGLYPSGYNFLNSTFITTVGNVNMTSGMFCLAIPLLITAFIVLEEKYRYIYLVAGAICLFTEMVCRTESGIVGLAGSLVILIPIVINTKERILGGLIAGFILSAVVAVKSTLTVTYTGYVHVCNFLITNTTKMCMALMVTFFVLWVILKIFEKKITVSRKKMTLSLSIIMILAVIGSLSVVYFKGDSINVGMIKEAHQMMHGNFEDDFGSGRIFIWRRCMPIIKENPIIGTGPDSFMNVFMNRYNQEVSQNYDFAHNDYIQLMINYGILGLATYLAALFAIAKRSLKLSVHNEKILVLGASMLCYCIQIFFSFSIVLVAPVFWIIYGLLEKTIKDTKNESAVV